MSAEDIPAEIRGEKFYQHIDMGFVNRRLGLSALPPELSKYYIEHANPGDDHLSVLANDHLLVQMHLDLCDKINVPTLREALTLGKPRCMFRSTERLAPCPDIYKAERVAHAVELELDFGKPVIVAYHTEHLVSSTGKMTLAAGAVDGYVEAIVGLLHDKSDRFEIEPIIIGAPMLDHPRNGEVSGALIWSGAGFGEILPEDIEQFSRMSDVTVASDAEWMDVMRITPEEDVKIAFAGLLNEPTKKDWGGEANDHFSSNVLVNGKRRTAAFLLKGPTNFREMTLEMCGKRADQIFRLTNSGGDISIVQHSHLVGEAVRGTLRAMTVYPGTHSRKYCVIDGQATYRILKAYSLLK